MGQPVFQILILLNKTKIIEILIKSIISPVILRAQKYRPHFGYARTKSIFFNINARILLLTFDLRF